MPSSRTTLQLVGSSLSRGGALVNDMLVLSQLAFGCPSQTIKIIELRNTLQRVTERPAPGSMAAGTSRRMLAPGADSSMGKTGTGTAAFLAYHQFMGSWKGRSTGDGKGGHVPGWDEDARQEGG
jgi:hypothetical protein